MNETNYAQTLIKRIIAIIIYLLFGSMFTNSIIRTLLNAKFNLLKLVLFSFVIFFMVMRIIKSVKDIIIVIKEIKKTKKINIYIRDIGQVCIGVSIIAIITNLALLMFNIKLSGTFYKIIAIGVIIGIILHIIDNIMESMKANNIILEIDKSDE